MVGLTPYMITALHEAAAQGGSVCKPATMRKLSLFGLVGRKQTLYPGDLYNCPMLVVSYHLTDKGREALQRHPTGRS